MNTAVQLLLRGRQSRGGVPSQHADKGGRPHAKGGPPSAAQDSKPTLNAMFYRPSHTAVRDLPPLHHPTAFYTEVEGVRLVERGCSTGFNTHGGSGAGGGTGAGGGRTKPSAGILYLTATHLIFVDSEAKKETWILHMHISSVEKLPLSTQGSPLMLRCKTFLSVTFIIPRERDCHEIYTALQQLSQPVSLDELFCFHYMNSSSGGGGGNNNSPASGWDLYSPEQEFARMNVPNSAWVPTALNKNYEICDTYPQELFVPASAATKVILGSSKFRSKGRFPILTYLCSNNAALCRCSQPLSGFSARCLEDEQMLEAIRKANPGCGHMTVVDTRPKINAMANRATGKGYEIEAFYEHMKFHFAGIENIHTMRSSLARLVDTCQLVSPSISTWLSGLEGSGWLRHVRSVLESGALVARELQAGVSVLVHCSDGWDRTAQTCALAQILVDPYYRTLHGFQVLIEKEWLSFGHKFTERSALIQGDSKEVSPIFTQFLDCVWQLQQMFPCSFEFNERYLLVLHDHVFSAQFGTFVGNCQKDRVDLRLSQRTVSLWSYLSGQVMEHTNPLYRPGAAPQHLTPLLAPQAIQFWRGLYCRFWCGVHPREPLCDHLSAAQDRCTALRSHASFLTQRITWMTQLLAEHKQRGMKQLDNRLVEDNCQNGGVKFDPLGAFSLQRMEESLTAVGALQRDAGLSPSLEGNPLLIQTSPDKMTTPISPHADLVTVCPSTSTGVLPPSPRCRVPLSASISGVAVDWQSLRSINECSCSTPFHASSRKHHCWMCGEVFCTRCIDKRASLPGHSDLPAAPVCRPCYKTVTRSLSVDTP